MIELTPEMRAAVKRRMGVPDGQELDPWMGAAIEDVLAIVERDYRVSKRKGPLAPPCADESPDGHRCERNPHSKGRHAASGIGPRAGELVHW